MFYYFSSLSRLSRHFENRSRPSLFCSLFQLWLCISIEFLTADFLFPKVRHKHFLHGDLKLKCTATISTVYWKSNEESVQGSGFNAHTAPVSESRGRTSGTNRRLVPRDIILSASLSTRLYCACKVSICLLTTITSSLKSFKITPSKLLSLYRYESYFRPTKY